MKCTRNTYLNYTGKIFQCENQQLKHVYFILTDSFSQN
jgi:hypothetical protein